jgi:hypothetical protein
MATFPPIGPTSTGGLRNGFYGALPSTIQITDVAAAAKEITPKNDRLQPVTAGGRFRDI